MHTYTQESITKLDDQVTVKGTVDGVAVTVSFWASAAASMTDAEKVVFVAGLMLAQLPPQPEDLSGQFPSTITL
jgi:hypothetical protein